MKKQSMFGAKRSQVRRAIPAFGTEAEEAEWWFQNRKVHENQLVAAANTGEAQILTREKSMERIAASRKAPAPVVALRIPQSIWRWLGSRPRKRDCLTRPILMRSCMRRWWRRRGEG